MHWLLAATSLVSILQGGGMQASPANNDLTPKEIRALKVRVVEAAARDTGFQLDRTISIMHMDGWQGKDMKVEVDCRQDIKVDGRHYKGIFLRQPWDGQLFANAKLTYKALVVGGDTVAGEIRGVERMLTMEDKECGQVWSRDFAAEPTWELKEKVSAKLLDRVESGNEYPCHLHKETVTVYDHRQGPLYLGGDGRVRNSRSIKVLRKYITSVEEFERIRDGWLDRTISIRDGEVIEPQPPR